MEILENFGGILEIFSNLEKFSRNFSEVSKIFKLFSTFLQHKQVTVKNLKFFWNLPKFLIHALESTLFRRQCPPTENRFQIDPFPLDLIQRMQKFVQIRQTRFPNSGLIDEKRIKRRIFQRRQKRLIVSDLIDDVFPIFDHFDDFSARIRIIDQSKSRTGGPKFQLTNRFSNRHFALRSCVQILNVAKNF